MLCICIVVANSEIAKFFQTKDHGKTIDLIHELKNPAAHLLNQDLTSDKMGHYAKSAETRGAYEDHTDPKEYTLMRFAHEISDFLTEQHKAHNLDKIVIFAPPHFFGLINKSLPTKVPTGHYPKDYVTLPLKELFQIIRNHLPLELS